MEWLLLALASALVIAWTKRGAPPSDNSADDVEVEDVPLTAQGNVSAPASDPVWWRSDHAAAAGVNNVPGDPRVFENLARLRQTILDNFGVDVTLTSAYRSPETNALVGGAGGTCSALDSSHCSLHTAGRAADLAPPPGITLEEFTTLARSQGVWREIIPYPNDGHLHVAI